MLGQNMGRKIGDESKLRKGFFGLSKIMTMGEQKKYLIDMIDKAIIEAPKFFRRGLTIEESSYVLIQIPNSTTFRIFNSKKMLAEFRKKVIRGFPHSCYPSRNLVNDELKPTGRRVSPRDDADYEYVCEYSPKRVINSDYNPGDEGKFLVGEGWFTNGCYAIKDNAPKEFGKGKEIGVLTEEMVRDGIVLPMDGYRKTDFIVEFHPIGLSTNLVVVGSGEDRVYIQATYLDLVMKHFPQAVLYFKNGNVPILFKKGNEQVAIIMSYKFEKELPVIVENFLKEKGIPL